MTLTAKEALGHVRHALSSDKMPTVGGLRILNDAGESLVNMHSWRWLEGAQAFLSLRSGVDHVWLPENFRELMSVVASNSLNAGIELTTPDQIARHRADSSGTALHYLAAVVYSPREVKSYADVKVMSTPAGTTTFSIVSGGSTVVFNFTSDDLDTLVFSSTARYVARAITAIDCATNLINAINDAPDLTVHAVGDGTAAFEVRSNIAGDYIADTFSVATNATAEINLNGSGVASANAHTVSGPGGAPRPRLDLWPTPGADKIDGLTAYFRAGWRFIRGDKDAISVPAFMEPLYLQMVRTFALGYERDSEADIARRLGAIRGSSMFKDARTRDAQLHPTYGPILHGSAAAELSGVSPMWNYGSVGGPS